MKKIFALMLAVSLAALGCDDKKTTTKPAGSKVEETKKTTDVKDGKATTVEEKKTTESKVEVKPAEPEKKTEATKKDEPKLPDPPKK